MESSFSICFSCKLKWQQGGQLSLIEIQGILSPRHSVSSTVFLWLMPFCLLSSTFGLPIIFFAQSFCFPNFFSPLKPFLGLCLSVPGFLGLWQVYFDALLIQMKCISHCVLFLWLCTHYLRRDLSVYLNRIQKHCDKVLIKPRCYFSTDIYVLPTCSDHIAHSGSGLCWAV